MVTVNSVAILNPLSLSLPNHHPSYAKPSFQRFHTPATSSSALNTCRKHDKLQEALSLFDHMRNEESWCNAISAYSQSKNYTQALHLFIKMLCQGVILNDTVMRCVLSVVTRLGDVGVGRQLHGWLIRSGGLMDVSIHASLVTMYSNSGLLDDAQRVFGELPDSFLYDVYDINQSWDEVFGVFGNLMSTGIVLMTARIYASVINACSNARAEKYGRIIHGRIVKDGMLEETILGNSLVTMYAKCGNIKQGNQVFDRMSRKDVVSWNSVIAGNQQNGEFEMSMKLFRRMVKIGQLFQPNRITFLSVLSAISGASALKQGREVHAQIIRSGLQCSTSIMNSLITMYSKCEEVGKAELVFEKVPFKDMVTWNSMLSGYEQNEQLVCFFQFFKKMLLSGVEPDNHTFTMLLSASSSLQSDLQYSSVGREVHGYIVRRVPSENLATSTCNAILNMYAKTNRIAYAEKIFEEMSEKDTYTWNAMIEGYSLSGHSEKAVRIFLEMHEQRLPSDYMTFSVLLTVCGRLVSVNLGQQFHAFIVKQMRQYGITHPKFLLSIHNALISMYAKCGSIGDAHTAFMRMKNKDVFSWTTMITGYAHHGMATEAFEFFEKMKQDAIKPNSVSFLGLLTACAHAGLVEEGIHYFTSISPVYGIKPRVEHYACMVDLFGRLGQLEQAKKFVDTGITLFKDNHDDCLNLWKVLLGACHAHKQLELGVHTAMKILESEPEDETTHILLLNLYASYGMWQDAVKVRRWMRIKGLQKQEPGCSWIETKDRRHIFVAGDISHPDRKEIYLKLEKVNRGCREIGYVPLTEYVLHDVDESQKEDIIGCHSEKLAVSFGLLQGGIQRRSVIRVMKNLRICKDCHNWMKFCSQLEGREIALRDSRRFHFFKDGNCSCRDFW